MGDYNGWKNHATWHIGLIVANDKATLDAAQKAFDRAYYRARFEHFLANRTEDKPYDNWRESDRQGILGAAERMKDWAERLMEQCVDLETTARPPDITPIHMRTTEKRIAQLAVQRSMRAIAQQAIRDTLDECDWVEIAEMLDERRKEILAYSLANEGPREGATSAV